MRDKYTLPEVHCILTLDDSPVDIAKFRAAALEAGWTKKELDYVIGCAVSEIGGWDEAPYLLYFYCVEYFDLCALIMRVESDLLEEHSMRSGRETLAEQTRPG